MTTTQRPVVPPEAEISVNSVVARLRQIARQTPERVALREKEFGIWQETNYLEYWDAVRTVGMALRSLGVEPGDVVAIHSENRKAWVISDLGAQSIGAVSVGLYPTNPTPEVLYLLQHSEARVLIAEDQEQVDKALAVKDQLPHLTRIIYIEPRGVRNYRDPLLMSWTEFMELGEDALASEPTFVDRLVDDIDPDSLATLVYTSGTTGPPKGAMLSHRNIVWVMDRVPEVVAAGLTDMPDPVEILSYLPLCHVAEKLYSTINVLYFAGIVNFAESIDTVAADLREVQPTVFLGVPRIWEKLHAGILLRMQDASPVKRFIFGLAMKAGMWNADRILETGRRGFLGELVHWPFHVLCYRSLKDKIGMRHAVGALSAAAPIAPEVLKFFMALGVPIFEGYGQTENTAYATVNRMGDSKLGTVGVPNPGCEVKLGTDGEIMVRHPAVFVGYFKDTEATAEARTPDGWLHTGDVGEWDGDHLKIVDRKKDIIVTAGGKNLSPSEIENKLKVSPFIKEAIVIGDRRKFVSALIGIELDTVSAWALRKNIPFTTFRDLTEKSEVRELIQKEVDRVNEDFARVEQVREFRLMPKALDHEDGELTATQKVKRSKISEMFSELITDIYGS